MNYQSYDQPVVIENTEDALAINRQHYTMKRVLKKLSEAFKTEEVYVAGGMIRDHYFGKPGEDMDVYLNVPEGYDPNFLLPAILGIENFNEVEQMRSEDDSYDYADEMIEQVIKCKTTYYERVTSSQNVQEVQIIFLKREITPRQYIAFGFCCSLSKAYRSSDGVTSYTREFLNSVINKELSFDWEFRNMEVNHKYVKKMLRKFPDFEIDKATLDNHKRELAREQYR
jgi:hypothetical protein